MDRLLPIITIVLVALWVILFGVWCYYLGRLRGIQEMLDTDKSKDDPQEKEED